MEDAEWLFGWGRGTRRDSTRRLMPMSGTPVIILGHFDFSRKRGGPWLELNSNKDSLVQLPPDPMAVEEALIPIIQIPEVSRPHLKNKERYIHAEDTLRARGIIRPEVKLTKSIDFNKLKREKAAREARKKAKQEKSKIQ